MCNCFVVQVCCKCDDMMNGKEKVKPGVDTWPTAANITKGTTKL